MMGILRIRDLDPLFFTIQYHAHHFTYNLDALWTAVMGPQTLADLVAGIFTGESSALASVKAGLEAAWDWIKGAGQYILDSVLDGVFKGFTEMSKLILSSLLYIIATAFQESIAVNYETDGITAQFSDGSITKFIVDYKNRKMLLNNSVLDYMNPLSSIETLSVDPTVLSFTLYIVLLSCTLLMSIALTIMTGLDDGRSAALAVLIFLVMMGIIIFANHELLIASNKETSDIYKEVITNYLMILSLGSFLSLADDGKKFNTGLLVAVAFKTANDIGNDFANAIFNPDIGLNIGEILLKNTWKAISSLGAAIVTNYMEDTIGKGGFKGGHGFTLSTFGILFFLGFLYPFLFDTFEECCIHE